jgi:hypothetical protein
MDHSTDKLQSKIGTAALYVDLHELTLPGTHFQYSSDDAKQILILHSVNETLSIQITLPNNLFEWFINILDSSGQIVASTWVDHYGNSDEELKKEMRDEINQFIKMVSTHQTRVTSGEKKTFQYYESENWNNFNLF